MALIEDIKNDLEAGVVKMIHEYRDVLFAEAVRLLNDRHEAEDLVFRVFETILAKIDTYNAEKGGFLSWAKGIMRNEATLMRRGKVAKATIPVDPAELRAQMSEVDDSTEKEILLHSDSELLHEAFKMLPKEMQDAMFLHYVSDLSIAEVAKLLKVQPGTVKMRLHRARKFLLHRLEAKMKGKKPLAVLAAVLFGAGALFGAWQAGVAIVDSMSEAESVSEVESTPEVEPTPEVGRAVSMKPPTTENNQIPLTTTKEKPPMNKITKTLLSAASALTLMTSASAEVPSGNSWTVSGVTYSKSASAGVLTENVAEGQKPWILKVSKAANKVELTIASVTQEGDSTVLDFTTITDPNDNDRIYKVTVFGSSVFSGKTSIQYVIAPEAITFNGSSFSGCKGLIDIVWKEGVTLSLSASCFYNCTSLTFGSHYDAERDCIDLDRMGAIKNQNLSGVTGTVSLRGIAFNATHQSTFKGWSGVTGLILKEDSTHAFSSTHPFGGWTSLQTVKGLERCSSFPYLLFADSKDLVDIAIGGDRWSPTENGINIGSSGTSSSGFCRNFIKLEKVWFGNNVTNLCAGAFSGCTSLNYLRWPAEKPTVNSYALKDVGKNAVFRQYFPIGNTGWKAEIEGDANYTPWKDLPGETKAIYTATYPGEPAPVGYCSAENRTALLFKGFVFFYLTSGFNVTSSEREHGTYDPALDTYMDYNVVGQDYTFTATDEVVVQEAERWHARGAEVVNIIDGTKTSYEGGSVTVAYMGSPLDLTWDVKHEFKVSASGEGCTIDGAGWFAEGEDVTLTATPTDPSATFRGWTVNGVEVPEVTQPTLTLTMDEAKTVTAKFEVLTSEHVTIATNDGQSHGVPGPGDYGLVEKYNGEPIQIDADYTFTNTAFEVVEEDAYRFACTGYKVIVDSTQETSKEGADLSVTITYEEPCTIEWQWVPESYLDLTVGENGTVDRESGWLRDGVYTLTATPSADYIVDTWKVNGEVQETKGTTIEVTVEDAPVSVEVSFKYAPVGVTIVTWTADGPVTNEVTRIPSDGEITIPNETPDVVVKENEARKHCIGWEVVSYRSGETVASGDGASATFDYKAAEPVQLIWQWSDQYYVSAVVKGTDGETIDPERCAVTGASGYYSPGDQVSFTVAPLDHFLGWGGVEADKRNNPTVTFTVASAAKKFTAYCLANDKANLIVNGNFEEYGYGYNPGVQAYAQHYFRDAGSWECAYLEGGNFDGGGYYYGTTFGSNLTVHQGEYAGWLGSTKTSTNELRCAVNLPAKGVYSLNFWYRRANNNSNLGANTWKLYVRLEGVGKNEGVKIPLGEAIQVEYNTTWHEVKLENLSVDRAGPFKLVISQPGGEISGGYQYAITGFDDFSFKLVKPLAGMMLIIR